uniref:MADF domain-containing protein n=1 Tax=Anopheles maculatus TaxID=74869 RepID=A0A182SL50_9DIPT
MRHSRYYNKTVRGNALQEIVEDVRQQRPETTMKDVVRKIQTLRTQFGQELTKIRRHSQNGSEYHPTVWWFKGLNFLHHHIKPRTGGNCSINLSQGDIDSWKQDPDESSNTFKVSIVRKDGSASPGELHGADSGEEMEYETEVHYEINPIDMKDIKALELKPILPGTSTAHKRESRFVDREDRKVARITAVAAADDQQSHRALSPAPPADEPANNVPVPESTMDPLANLTPLNKITLSSPNDRHKSMGLFVGAQMSCLKDDYIYYETQMEILNIMTRGILRQLALDKKNKAAQDASNEKNNSD